MFLGFLAASVKFSVFDLMAFWHFSPCKSHETNETWEALKRFPHGIVPRNPRLFDGSKFRLQKVSFDKDAKLLRLQLGLTSYKEPKTDLGFYNAHPNWKGSFSFWISLQSYSTDVGHCVFEDFRLVSAQPLDVSNGRSTWERIAWTRKSAKSFAKMALSTLETRLQCAVGFREDLTVRSSFCCGRQEVKKMKIHREILKLYEFWSVTVDDPCHYETMIPPWIFKHGNIAGKLVLLQRITSFETMKLPAGSLFLQCAGLWSSTMHQRSAACSPPT